MKKALVIGIALCGTLLASGARAGNGTPVNQGSANAITLAVYGDWPYSLALLEAAPLLIDSINSDPKVRLVIHVGDIHSGSMPCTGAGLTPVPPGAIPGWNQGILDLLEPLKRPPVDTPGRQEWPGPP